MPLPPLAVGVPPMFVPVGLQLEIDWFEPALATGLGLTVTVEPEVALQPCVSVTVNEYEVVPEGLTVGLAIAAAPLFQV